MRLSPTIIGDARDLRTLTKGYPRPRTIITSPPYFDMLDYGPKNQVGYGQSEADYLTDVVEILRACCEVSSADATLWLIVGAVRRQNRLIDLPGKLVREAEKAGWFLREDITWSKGKALPWVKHGELRDVTERVLLFSKEDDFYFDASELRSPEPQSFWWRRYPERYSPLGALPTNILEIPNVWDIPIPTQGSWKGKRLHLCPFPPELAYRLISLTSRPADAVLDPFAGSWSVPAMANAMGRIGYGIELSPSYQDLYDDSRAAAQTFLSSLDVSEARRETFRSTIEELRMLKFARLVGDGLTRAGSPPTAIIVNRSRRKPSQPFAILSAELEIAGVPDQTAASKVVSDLIKRPPLSKFGIDARCRFTVKLDTKKMLWWWEGGHFWKPPSREMSKSTVFQVAAPFRPDPDSIDPTPYG